MMSSRNMVGKRRHLLVSQETGLAKAGRNVDLQLTASADSGLGMGMTMQNS